MEAGNRLRYEKKTAMVVLLTAATMVVEIIFGLSTNSMALLADGIHMGSHVFAIGLSWVAYIFVRKANTSKTFSGNPDKILSLSGYSSGILLMSFALLILIESIQRFISPAEIRFREAIFIAVIGLIVNIVSAVILHHEEEESDHNIRSAYLHVLADAITSITAIAGLTAALVWNITWLDSIAGILGSLLIIRWAVILLADSGRVLLDIKKE